MRLTPLDIRQQQFRRVMRGLDPEEVEQFLSTVAAEFEAVVSGNNDLRHKVLELEEKIVEYKGMEKALRDALLAAEKVMGEAKESAQREASLILREAELQAERAKSRLVHDLQRLHEDVSELRRVKDGYLARVRWLLRSQLDLIDGHAQEFTEIDAGLGAASPFPGGERSFGAAVDRALTDSGTRPPAPAPEWHASEPAAGPLDDVLRPIGPDGTYEAQRSTPPSRPLSSEEVAQAARRAEKLAAEARAALERHGGGSPRTPDADWNADRRREGPNPRP